MVDNPIERYSIGDRTKGIKYNDDGSLTIYVQNEKPEGDKKANWLPAPEGPFYLVIRAYNTEAPIFNGSWAPPFVQMVD